MAGIHQCISQGREKRSVVVDMDGALLIDPNPFSYFALIAFDVGGILRLGLLLLVFPVALLLQYFVSKSASTRVLIFVTFAGVKVSDIESAAKAVLPKYYSEDLHPETWRVFSSCGKKCVVTMNPRIMVEPFLKNYLDVDFVLGTEISSFMGFATGLVANPGLLAGEKMSIAVKKVVGSSSMVDVGIGHLESQFPFMNHCKEGYIVSSGQIGICAVRTNDLPKPVIFHDGRFVQKPTPLIALLIALWLPVGFLLSIVRITIVASFVPFPFFYYAMRLLGCKINVKGTPPCSTTRSTSGTVVVCNHKCFFDPVIVSSILPGRTFGVTYSVSRLAEFLSPIRTCQLTRDRVKDGIIMKQILNDGWQLVMCPEGTTCREPYLLRFSPLFAELTDQIVPAAVSVKMGMFHGTTARGYKWMDIFFFFMNPLPVYEVTFLNKLADDQTCSAGKSSCEIANNVQEIIGEALKFKCTTFTRKDKYQMLAGTNGLVGKKP